jgi:hypothetical protein
MVIVNDKKRFICYELGLLSLKAALSTRDGENPVYSKTVKIHQRKKEKQIFRKVLESVEELYSKGNISEQDHVAFIEKTANDISTKLSNKLHKGRFRIGVSQKLINLHLKYLWATGHIPEPPHCPIDGIIRDKANIMYDWTTSDSIDEYIEAVSALKNVAGQKSLAIWELETFRRRDED